MKKVESTRYVCDSCHFETNVKPSTFPKCPACGFNRAFTAGHQVKRMVEDKMHLTVKGDAIV